MKNLAIVSIIALSTVFAATSASADVYQTVYFPNGYQPSVPVKMTVKDKLMQEAGSWNGRHLQHTGRVVNCQPMTVVTGQCVVNKYNQGGTVTINTLFCDLNRNAGQACQLMSAETKAY